MAVQAIPAFLLTLLMGAAMLKRLLLVLLCMSVGLLTGLFLSGHLANLYAPQTGPLVVKMPVKDSSVVFDYR